MGEGYWGSTTQLCTQKLISAGQLLIINRPISVFTVITLTLMTWMLDLRYSQGAKTDIVTYVDTSGYKLTTDPVSIIDPATCILARLSA